MSYIRIKRSSTSGNPANLVAGELAYSALADNGANGGDRLYIGMGSESGSPLNAASHIVIGGKYFTDMMDHARGTLTANSAILVDSNSKIDVINIGNLTVTGSTNTITSTNTNGNIVFTPDGTGYVKINGTNGLVIPAGTTAQQGPAVTGAIRFNTSTTQFEGYSGSNWSSLGGVRSVDGLTYIIAESSPAASDDILHFYASNNSTAVEVAQLSATALTILNTTANSGNNATSGALQVAGGAGIAGDLYIGGNLVINGTQTDIGAVSFKDGLTLSGSTTAATEYFTINNGAGTPVIKFQVDTATGNTSISGTLDVTGTTTLAAVNATNGSFSGDLSVATSKFTVASATGNTAVDGTLSAKGDFAVNTTKFTVAASTGNTAVDGTLGVKSDLAVNTNKFTVTASSGDTIVAGTMGIGGDVNVNLGKFTITAASGNTEIAGTLAVTDDFAVNTDKFTVVASSGNTAVAGTLSVTGIATFHNEVSLDSHKITNLQDPQNPQDAATKNYVDTMAQGLHVHAPVDFTTSAPIPGTVTYTDGPDPLNPGVGAYLTIPNGTQFDYYNIDLGGLEYATFLNHPQERLLVKDQADAKQNGVYVWTTATTLTRATDADETGDFDGGDFMFVTDSGAGFVQTSEHTVFGTDPITFAQFSGEGSWLAGDGLTLTSNTFNVNLAATGGLEFVSNDIALKDSVAGDGLTITAGVIDVVGTTNRITVGANSIDIASTYVGQTSITTLGTIGTGTWQGNVIASAYGGTGISTYTTGDILYASATDTLTKLSMGTAGQILQVNTAGTGLVYADLDGGTY
jgi:hypothetical protein